MDLGRIQKNEIRTPLLCSKLKIRLRTNQETLLRSLMQWNGLVKILKSSKQKYSTGNVAYSMTFKCQGCTAHFLFFIRTVWLVHFLFL